MNRKQLKYVHWLDRPDVYILVLYLFWGILHRPTIYHSSEFLIILFSSQSFYVWKMQKWSTIYGAYINAIGHKSVFFVMNILCQSLLFNCSKQRPGVSSVLGNLQEAHGSFHVCSLCVSLFGSSMHVWLKILNFSFSSVKLVYTIWNYIQ
jgi:hypothetical protein